MDRARFDFMRIWLREEWVPFDVISFLYGIQPDDELLWGSFHAWGMRQRRPREVLRNGGENRQELNRHAFENYLQHMTQLPTKLAAARTGMNKASFEKLLAAMEEKGMLILNTMAFSPQVVPESLLRHMNGCFPDLQHRIFNDHNDYCKRLHDAIRTDLGLEVEAIRCVTSAAMGEAPADYAYQYDCFTGEPIGLRYQVWLDFKKPLNLRPDACSLKLYAENEVELKPLVFAGRPYDIPEPLKTAHP